MVRGFDQLRPSSCEIIRLTTVFSPSNSFQTMVTPCEPASTKGRWSAIGLADRKRIGKGLSAVPRRGIEQALANPSIGVPRNVIGPVRRDRKAGALMRTGRDLPLVMTDALNLAGSLEVRERHDRMVANAAVENVPEHDDRMAPAIEGNGEPATFAGVVLHQPGFAIGRPAIFRDGEEQPCPIIFPAVLPRRNTVALVEPGGEDGPIGIERECLEALAFVVRRDRTRLRKALAAAA